MFFDKPESVKDSNDRLGVKTDAVKRRGVIYHVPSGALSPLRELFVPWRLRNVMNHAPTPAGLSVSQRIAERDKSTPYRSHHT